MLFRSLDLAAVAARVGIGHPHIVVSDLGIGKLLAEPEPEAVGHPLGEPQGLGEQIVGIEEHDLRSGADLSHQRGHHRIAETASHDQLVAEASVGPGSTVAGDTVNLCAKLSATAQAEEIILTSQAVSELPKQYRAACHPSDAIHLPGLPATIEVFKLRWRDSREIPRILVILETGQQIAIPDKSVISCGRFSDQTSENSNDIVLVLPDPLLSQRISRWHFELRSEANQLFLRAVSDKPTVVNGISLRKGEQAVIENGARVQLSGVMTLTFGTEQVQPVQQDLTFPHQTSP